MLQRSYRKSFRVSNYGTFRFSHDNLYIFLDTTKNILPFIGAVLFASIITRASIFIRPHLIAKRFRANVTRSAAADDDDEDDDEDAAKGTRSPFRLGARS